MTINFSARADTSQTLYYVIAISNSSSAPSYSDSNVNVFYDNNCAPCSPPRVPSVNGDSQGANSGQSWAWNEYDYRNFSLNITVPSGYTGTKYLHVMIASGQWDTRITQYNGTAYQNIGTIAINACASGSPTNSPTFTATPTRTPSYTRSPTYTRTTVVSPTFTRTGTPTFTRTGT
ncbi:MAG TPA: hypothetical protein P5511_07265, partial [Candidatus Goldiibacteriota bacterium]|nr:hypothetical protein [Candidatus Goldiibacteriota bacterium]